MREHDRRRNDVEHLQSSEDLFRISARVDDHALFLSGGNDVRVCVEWTHDNAFDHFYYLI